MFLHDMMLLGGQSAPYVAENRSTTNNLGSTSQPVNISSRTLVGDLLVAMVGGEADRIYTWPAGWTELADEVNGTSSSATVAYKVAESSDIGSSITVSSSGTSQKSASFCLSIRGAWALPNISTVAVGTSTSPDPNSLTYNVSRQKLWLAMTGGRLNSDLVGSG